MANNRILIETTPGKGTRWNIAGTTSEKPAAGAGNAGLPYYDSTLSTWSVSTGSVYVTPSGGAAPLTVATITTTPYAMDGTIQSLLIDATSGDRSIVLPAPATNKGPFYLQRLDTSSHVVTVNHHASEAVGTGTSISLGAIHQAVILTSDTVNWFIGA